MILQWVKKQEHGRSNLRLQTPQHVQQIKLSGAVGFKLKSI
ncbi:MAG: hypothetical protein Q8N09_07825 [Thermodesulfovibrionia bacterium]|nr:hypothetical protein [Thermodesulfovibrionia bacterium]